MQLATTVSHTLIGDIVQAVDGILQRHIVVNKLGIFRWQKDSGGRDESTFAQYRLEFCSPHNILWFEIAQRSCVVLALKEEAIDRNRLAHLRWELNSLFINRDFCERIVQETESEIASVLAELLNLKLEGSHGNEQTTMAYCQHKPKRGRVICSACHTWGDWRCYGNTNREKFSSALCGK